MNRFIKIGEAAKILGVSVQTLRRWELKGSLVPAKKMHGTRYYDYEDLLGIKNVESDLTIARTSSIYAAKGSNSSSRSLNSSHGKVRRPSHVSRSKSHPLDGFFIGESGLRTHVGSNRAVGELDEHVSALARRA